MAGRIRSIKPEILDDAKSAGLDDHTWRLWVSLWLVADDHGAFRCQDARQVHGLVFWSSATTPDETAASLARLSRESLVTFYEVRGQRYGKVTNWKKHQRVDHPGNPRVPQPDEKEATVITWGAEDLARASRESRESLAPDLRSGSGSPTNAVREKLAKAPGVQPQEPLPGVPIPPAAEETEHVGWAAIKNAWWSAYRQMTGQDPAPNKRQWGQLKRTLHERAKGDAGEVVRRIKVLFESPPRFLAGTPPDFATLEEHWEKLAAPSGTNGTQHESPSSLFDGDDEKERRLRAKAIARRDEIERKKGHTC